MSDLDYVAYIPLIILVGAIAIGFNTASVVHGWIRGLK